MRAMTRKAAIRAEESSTIAIQALHRDHPAHDAYAIGFSGPITRGMLLRYITIGMTMISSARLLAECRVRRVKRIIAIDTFAGNG